MPLSHAGRAPATFELKSAQLPLVALLLKSPDLRRVAQELQERFGDMPDFFDHDGLLLDLSAVREETIDFGQLASLLRRFRLMPLAVRGAGEAQVQAAREAGLAAAEDTAPRQERSHPQAAEAGAPAAEPPAPAADPAPSLVAPSALVVDKPLRSGQQIYARGRDLIVLSMVNPGAEVIADGHIHVYAPLRGKAIAGARGNTEARILTLCLEAELLSIAGVYRTSEVALPGPLQGKPAQVRLAGGSEGKLVMEALSA